MRGTLVLALHLTWLIDCSREATDNLFATLTSLLSPSAVHIQVAQGFLNKRSDTFTAYLSNEAISVGVQRPFIERAHASE